MTQKKPLYSLAEEAALVLSENLRDERSRWLQQPDYDSQDCCSYADSLERESSAQRRGGG